MLQTRMLLTTIILFLVASCGWTLCPAQTNAPPMVSNVGASERAGEGLIDIAFDVSDADSPQVQISIYYSVDGGETWESKCTDVTGDVGGGVIPGTGLLATWNAALDHPGYSLQDLRFRVYADDGSGPRPDQVWIPAGTFVMGTPETDPYYLEEQIQHTVTLTRSFFMQATQVTREAYLDLLGYLPAENDGCPQCPVRTVTWYDTINYCNARSIADGLTPAYEGSGSAWTWNQAASGWRLPTEAEWEYACRAGTTTPYYTGACLSSTTDANFNGSEDQYPGCDLGEFRGGPMPVGSFPPNPWGLYDMAGNHYDWCWDWYAPYSPDPATDPTGPATGTTKIWRGGNYSHLANHCRSSYRLHAVPTWQLNLSFRLVRWAE